MNLRKLIFTKCDSYKAGKKITPKGIMVHSTGANNPWLKRYVGPDDGLLGVNKYNNHWNMPKVGASVHAFIGKLKNGDIATYQVLPWDYKAGHCYKGKNGSGNDTHIAFEICEDGLADAAYFGKVYKEAVELCAYLCKLYNLTEKNIICHSEGYKMGIASNHGDVMHWFPKHGKSMDTFRKDVAALLVKEAPKEETAATKKQLYRVRKAWNDAKSQIGAFVNLNYAKPLAKSNPGYKVFDINGKIVYDPAGTTSKKSVDEIAREVILGKWGNGTERKNKLTAAGYNYNAVQKRVNELLK